jgi:2-polyprenyl-3-methyl-5-hydroxy-6-metoxy-1,4-benzoquinol methylase
MHALNYVKKFNPLTFLDVGSKGGYHAKEMMINGSKVTCIDYGKSTYSKETKIDNLKIINIDFNKFKPPDQEKYEMVWASHILEHQRIIGLFLEKLIKCCSENGHICITVSDPHINLLGGHVSMWSPGLLCYNIVLCGIDISNSIFIRGTNEFSIFFRPIKFTLPGDLSYDFGDLKKLSQYLPQKFNENSNSWDVRYIKNNEM